MFQTGPLGFDNAGWELLFKMAGAMGLYDMEASFRQALVELVEEEQYLAQIRQWRENAVLEKAWLSVG